MVRNIVKVIDIDVMTKEEDRAYKWVDRWVRADFEDAFLSEHIYSIDIEDAVLTNKETKNMEIPMYVTKWETLLKKEHPTAAYFKVQEFVIITE